MKALFSGVVRRKGLDVGYGALGEVIGGGQAETLLNSGELRFRDLLEKLPAGAYTCDPDGLITYFNQHAVQLWGRAPALNHPADRYCGSFKLFSTEGSPISHDRCWMALALKTDRGYNEREIVVERPDGHRLTVLAHANPIHDASGELLGAVNVLVDISDRKRAEEELREAREAERQRMARDLHDEVLQDLAYALTATQIVHGTLEDTEEGEQLGQAVEALQRAGRGVRGAIYNLRSNSKHEDLGALLESLVELNRQRSSGCRIELSLGAGFPPPLSAAARTDLIRIVAEALTNVRRHSGAKNARVKAGCRDDGLWIEVEDDGDGFHLAAAAGTGLRGMSERAQGLGGRLVAESEPGLGTRVRVELSLETEPEAGPEAAVSRVLLVDDHASFRGAVASVFEKELHYAVVGQAGTLAEAREMLDGVDIAVVDLMLPDGFGGDLIQELRDRNPHAQALVLSANSERRELARAVESGAAGVLHKSVGMGEVLDAVRRLRAGETVLPLEEVVEILRYANSCKAEEHEALQAIAKLTQREREVLQLLAEGLDSKGTAERLNISVKTERHHVASILAKFGAHSRLQALVFALRHDIVRVH